jgi:hypothetical protein
MIPFGEFTAKLSRWVDRRIHLACERFLGWSQRLDDFTKRDFANDQDIHVAFSLCPPNGERSIQKRCDDPLGKQLQAFAKHTGNACGLEQEALEVREYRATRIDAECDSQVPIKARYW